MVSLAMWILGCDITLTDLQSAVAHIRRCVMKYVECLSREHATLCAGWENVRVRAYTWGDEATELPPPYNFLLGSDIVCEPGFVHALVSVFGKLCNERIVILVAYKARGLGEEYLFAELSNKFNCAVVLDDFQPMEFMNLDYKILRITAKHHTM